MSSDPAVVAEGISKRYRRGLFARSRLLEKRPPSQEFWALRNISFQAERGRVLGFIGPNGAGKSTLLKILARITPPTSGRAVLNGTSAALIEIGTGFHPELTGRENIFLSGAIHGMSRLDIKMRFDRIVEFSGVDHFLDTPVKRYSSGMFVRLGFAIAAHLDPEILIVDEVIAVGDGAFQAQCLERIVTLREQGTAVLWVSHDLEQIESLCDEVGLLQGGEIVSSGPPREVVSEYRKLTGQRAGPLEGVLDLARQDSGVEILSVSFAAGESLQAGDPLEIQIEIAGADGHIVSDPNVGFWIHSEDGALIFGTNTQLLSCSLPDLTQGTLTVTFELAQVPLPSGRYIVSAAVEDRTGVRHALAARARSLVVVDQGTNIGRVALVGQASWTREGTK